MYNAQGLLISETHEADIIRMVITEANESREDSPLSEDEIYERDQVLAKYGITPPDDDDADDTDTLSILLQQGDRLSITGLPGDVIFSGFNADALVLNIVPFDPSQWPAPSAQAASAPATPATGAQTVPAASTVVPAALPPATPPDAFNTPAGQSTEQSADQSTDKSTEQSDDQGSDQSDSADIAPPAVISDAPVGANAGAGDATPAETGDKLINSPSSSTPDTPTDDTKKKGKSSS